MSFRFVENPCRNFCIFNSLACVDPKDGREKLVLSNFTAGATGNIVLVDPATGEGESLTLPGDSGAWALLLLDAGTLLVGTCPRSGFLHRLDLPTRTWAEPLRVESETYIWNLARGSDGNVYGGSWPGCVLLRYDPVRHELRSMGRASADPENCYTRLVFGDVPGRLLINCGHHRDHITLWDIAAGRGEPFGRPGARVHRITPDFVCTRTGEETDFYHPLTLAPLDRETCAGKLLAEEVRLATELGGAARILKDLRLLRLADGTPAGVRGQEWFTARGGRMPVLARIPTAAPATTIHALAADGQGMLWGASGLGQTIFRYDPADRSYWNSPAVCDNGGEVYGICAIGGKLFLSAYAGGDHVLYDPAAPWDQVRGTNPMTLDAVGPALCRPEGRSVVGPDGAFWTGWMARYGTYGGGLSRVDPGTLAVDAWYDPVPGQSLSGLASGGRSLFFTTFGGANGLLARRGVFSFCVWDPSGRIVRRVELPSGDVPRLVAWAGGFAVVSVDRMADAAAGSPGAMALCDGTAVAVAGSELRIWDAAGEEFVRTVALEAPCTCLLAFGGDVLAFSGTRLLRVRPADGTAREISDVPEGVHVAAAVDDGAPAASRGLFFGHGVHLYRVEGV